MITFNPYSKNPFSADSQVINIGTRQQIELVSWVDERGNTHAILDPNSTADIPKDAKRTAFTVGWMIDTMLSQMAAREKKAFLRKLQEAAIDKICSPTEAAEIKALLGWDFFELSAIAANSTRGSDPIETVGRALKELRERHPSGRVIGLVPAPLVNLIQSNFADVEIIIEAPEHPVGPNEISAMLFIPGSISGDGIEDHSAVQEIVCSRPKEGEDQ